MDTTNLFATVAFIALTSVSTILTASVLFKHSKLFLTDIFHGKQDISIATNSLMKLGFYLLNFGLIFFLVEVSNYQEINHIVEGTSSKIGKFTIYLGIVLILHLVWLLKGRKAAKQNYTSEL